MQRDFDPRTCPDPRTRGPYITARKAYLARIASANCAICGKPVSMTAPRKSPFGATIEHRLPVRKILAESTTWAQVMALVCDTRLWGIAHSRCQSRQGAIARNTRAVPRAVMAPRRTTTRTW